MVKLNFAVDLSTHENTTYGLFLPSCVVVVVESFRFSYSAHYSSVDVIWCGTYGAGVVTGQTVTGMNSRDPDLSKPSTV